MPRPPLKPRPLQEKAPPQRGSVLPVAATTPLLLPGLLPEQPRVEQVRLCAERLGRQVDVALRRLEPGGPSAPSAPAADTPQRPRFVIDVRRPSWNGRT